MFRELALVYVLITSTTSDSIEPRVFGGSGVKKEEYDYVVALRQNNLPMCGGSILNPRFVLTAAHCIKDPDPKTPTISYSIQYGLTKITTGPNGKNIISVKNIFVHPYYVRTETVIKNDIAILELEKPIVLSSAAQPVTLPPVYNATPENDIATLVGWGFTTNKRKMVSDLQKADLRVYNVEECIKINKITNDEHHLCAGVPERGKTQCTGDSGGPLNLGRIQIGLVSFRTTHNCGEMPGVLTKISTHVLWIRYIIGGADSDADDCQFSPP